MFILCEWAVPVSVVVVCVCVRISILVSVSGSVLHLVLPMPSAALMARHARHVSIWWRRCAFF